MKLKKFVENFADQFDETDASELNEETKFKELDEWSSLVALSVISMVDDEYDVAIKGDDIRKAETILDLYKIVQAKAE